MFSLNVNSLITIRYQILSYIIYHILDTRKFSPLTGGFFLAPAEGLRALRAQKVNLADGQKDGRTEGRTDRRTDGQKDGQRV